MPELETVTAEPAAATILTMTQPSIVMDFPYEEAVTTTPVPEPEAQSEPDPTPPPAAEAPPPDRTANLSDLSKDEIDNLFKGNPALKRRFDGELGSRLQAREAAIRKEAADKALGDYNQEVADVNAAADWYETTEALRRTNPEEYERDWANNPNYHKWVANFLVTHENVTAKSKTRPVTTAPVGDRATQWSEFNAAALPEAKETIRAEAGDWYNNLPAENRNAIEAAVISEDSWLQTVIKQFVIGTKSYTDRAIRDATTAAREAGRREALAEREDGTPLQVNRPSSTAPLNATEVLIEHAANGFRNVSRAQLDAAYSEKGFNQ